MKPFMKPLYHEFEGHLYRLFNSTITEARNTYFEVTGKDLDQKYEKLFQKYGPRRVRAEMNWAHPLCSGDFRGKVNGQNDD